MKKSSTTDKIKKYITWIDEHFYSYIKYKKEGNVELAEQELEYLKDSIKKLTLLKDKI